MRITQYERDLARELAQAFCRPEFVDRDARMLAVVLWSHRQLPADSADEDRKLITQVEMYGECGALSNPMRFDDGADIRVRCRLGYCHPGLPHEGLIFGERYATTWFDGGAL